METDRRSLLKGLAAAATMSVVSTPARAGERRLPPDDAVGLLYDNTKCIGCKACVLACRENAGLSPDTDGYGGGLYDAPEGLNEYAKTVIQLAKLDGGETAYVKKQCMHCVDPACANACMLGALSKGEFGIVSWDSSRCVGCRYCEIACPFNVPKFEWAKLSPRIVKCEFCKERLAEGKEPACSAACPRGAVIYGKREELLKEAHQRLEAHPDRYVPKVYGEYELGGTQVLYLSHVPFETLGFRFHDPESVPNRQRDVQHWEYGGIIGPLALLLGAVTFRNRKAVAKAQHDGGSDHETNDETRSDG